MAFRSAFAFALALSQRGGDPNRALPLPAGGGSPYCAGGPPCHTALPAATQDGGVAADGCTSGCGDVQSISPSRPRDEEGFRRWFERELSTAPNQEAYSTLYADAVEAVVRWRRRFEGHPDMWKRLMKRDKVVKELIESAPVIQRVRELVEHESQLGPDERFTIVDLCSGKGYLSMYLAELLPPDKVERCVLVDIAWPRCGADMIGPGQMNWEHIYGSRTDEASGKQVRRGHSK